MENKETLEEAAERLYPNYQQEIFIKGAKWQQERMYSEEDLRNAHQMGANFAYGRKEATKTERLAHFYNWFEQYIHTLKQNNK